MYFNFVYLWILFRYYISQASLEDIFILLTNRYRIMGQPRRMESSFPGEMTQYEAESAALAKATRGTAN